MSGRETKPCTLCIHPQRLDVDRAFLAGDAERAIGARFGASKSAVNRHRSHVAKLLAPEPPRAAPDLPSRAVVARRLDFQAEVFRVLDEAERLGRLAEEAGDIKTAMGKLTHAMQVLTLVAGKRPAELAPQEEPWAELAPVERLARISAARRQLDVAEAKIRAAMLTASRPSG